MVQDWIKELCGVDIMSNDLAGFLQNPRDYVSEEDYPKVEPLLEVLRLNTKLEVGEKDEN